MITTNENFIQSYYLGDRSWYTYGNHWVVAKSADLSVYYYAAETINDSEFCQLKIFITKLKEIMQKTSKTLFLFTSGTDHNEVSIESETRRITYMPIDAQWFVVPCGTTIVVTIKNATDWMYKMARLNNMTYSDFNFNLPILPNKDDILEFIK